MAETTSAQLDSTRTDVRIGAVIEDTRSGERRLIIYADTRIVLLRAPTGSTTMTPRRTFENEFGTRYRPRPDEAPDIDGGQYDQLRDRLATYDHQDGRKARHKADALREAVDILAGGPRDGTTPESERDGGSRRQVKEVPFEEIPGIGPETARNLRSQGFVTVDDVNGASDEVLGAVAGVGEQAIANIRATLD